MIDIHCHILPGIDDGARDVDESLEMAVYAAKEGISGIIATPHYIHEPGRYTDIQSVEDKVGLLNEQLIKNSIDLKIYTGSEIFISPEIPFLIKQGSICSLNKSRYILIELPMGSIPLYTEEVFYELELLGLTPIIAHPERKSEIIKKPGILRPYIEKGILVQINSGSLMGFYGEAVAKTAWKLLENGMVNVVATDAHNTRSRAPMLNKAYKMVYKRMGKDVAEILFNINPALILRDQEVENIRRKTKKSFGIGRIIRLVRKNLRK